MKTIITILLLGISFSGFCDKFVWNSKAPYPSFPRHRSSALTIGNKGYMGLGHINSGTISQAYHDWWEFDPSTNSWTQKADYPLDRFAVTGFTIGNKGYLGAGNEQNFGDRAEFFEYNPITNIWTPKANFPIAAGGNISFAINGIGYMGFGNNTGLYSYNPSSDIWNPVATSIPSSDYASAFVINNKAYILPAFSNNFYEFNPSTGATTLKAPFIGDSRYAAVSFAVRNEGYIGLGWSSASSDCVKDFYFYNPSTNFWDTIPKSFPGVRRNYVPSFVIGDNAYFGTGSNGTNLGDIWGYEWKVSVGVNEYTNNETVSIYPNPTSEKLIITINEELLNAKPIIKLFQIEGNAVLDQNITAQSTIIDVSDLSKGIYFSALLDSNQNILSIKKIIIN